MTPTRRQIRIAFERMMARTTRQPNGCVTFDGAHNGDGYASVRVGPIMMSGHRLAWIHHYGRIPAGKNVLHSCDTPPCVNIECLHLGTHVQNMAEMRARNRSRAGERGTSAKLTDTQADEIRLRYLTEGVSQRALAAEYSVDQAQISRIISRRTFAAA